MERVINGLLTTMLRQAFSTYTGEVITPNGTSHFYLVENREEQFFCVVVPYISEALPADILLMAHLVDAQIIIDVDYMDDPLSETLQAMGVPAEQITLAWQQTDAIPQPDHAAV